jgi:23S rRNA (uracil1939-C5)-methyltransferase/tRNA (uracil-5-)-methyltransferase
VNPFLLPALVAHVVAEARAGGSRHLLDAYCGSGLLALSAAPHFASVTGIEVSQMAVQAAQRNAAANHISNAEFVWGKAQLLFEEVQHVQGKAARDTTVVIDPSRKGCDESFLEQLAAFSPARVVYVSCNPASQARDAAALTARGFQVTRVAPFDLFPQTKHVECVITLVNTRYTTS